MPHVFAPPSLKRVSTSSDETTLIRIEHVDLSLVNALRRVIISRIPNVGFVFDANDHSTEQSIRVEQNDTPLHHEYVMHRISLIPINLKTFDEIAEWDPSRYEFEINKVNEEGATMTHVTTKDFVVRDLQTNTLCPELAKRWFPPCPKTKDHILITKLYPKKHTAFCVKATAYVHPPAFKASFGIMSTCSFKNVVDEARAKEARAKLNGDEKALRVFDTMDVKRHYVVNDYGEPTVFEFKLVSACALSETDTFTRAFDVLLELIATARANFVVEASQQADGSESTPIYHIRMTNATHTEGNLLQSILFNHVIRDQHPDVPTKMKECGLKYAGYTITHPLEDCVVLKLIGKKLDTEQHARSFAEMTFDYVDSYVRGIKEEWIKNLS